jgi:hypothetical protein
MAPSVTNPAAAESDGIEITAILRESRGRLNQEYPNSMRNDAHRGTGRHTSFASVKSIFFDT